MRGDISRTTKLFQIKLRLNLARLNFDLWSSRLSLLSLPGNYSIWIKRQSEQSGLVPDIRAVLWLIFRSIYQLDNIVIQKQPFLMLNLWLLLIIALQEIKAPYIVEKQREGKAIQILLFLSDYNGRRTKFSKEISQKRSNQHFLSIYFKIFSYFWTAKFV